jgi:ABC-type multidrug transport system fused ATPase/permease subunit
MNYIQKLRSLLDRDAKRHLLWLVFLSVFVSVVETIGISAIMPFIDIATNFDNIHSNQYYQWIFDFFGFKDDVNFAIVFGLTLFGFYIFRGGVNLFYSYVMAHFTQNLYVKITRKLFKTYLTMPYQVFTNKNSSYLTKAIITESSLVCNVIGATLLMISEIFVIVFLYILMLFANWKITLVFTIILIIKMFLLTQTISKKIKVVGAIRAKTQAKFYEIINRLFGDFKNVKLQDKDRLEATSNDFFITVDEYAKANAVNAFLKSFPRLFLETTGFGLIVFVLITLLYLNQANVLYILPTLSLFVLALYRLLPSVNRIVSGYNMFMYYHASIDIVDEELRTPQEDLASETIKFSYKIELKNVEFSYQEKPVLENITLTINKGEKIAFIGNSGSGKSTLVDLIIGLYRPNQGEIKIDDVLLDKSNLQSWRSQIGYIPQQVYLFDGTIKDNVCFGRELDKDLLERVLKQANIFDFLQTKQGVKTLVGEGGVQLSGGQRQRIAIARALYGEPEILVLDEATSALDNETEQKIMDEIYQISNDKTLIIIAHRLSAVDRCDKTYKIEDGVIAKC